MKLHWLNLGGVLILTVICVEQWRQDRTLNLTVNRLEQTTQTQAAKLQQQEATLQGVNADLMEFKERFSRSETGLQDTRQKLRTAEREVVQLTTERDQLKVSVTNWAAAVELRDAKLKESYQQTRHLGEELNASIQKFNDLASNHNALVKEVNELRTRLAKPAAERTPSNP